MTSEEKTVAVFRVRDTDRGELFPSPVDFLLLEMQRSCIGEETRIQSGPQTILLETKLPLREPTKGQDQVFPGLSGENDFFRWKTWMEPQGKTLWVRKQIALKKDLPLCPIPAQVHLEEMLKWPDPMVAVELRGLDL